MREWDTRKHPSWLVFEVWQKSQIRPRQYRFAKHLIDNPRTIQQMNFGEGKTRFIMPMLILWWTFDAQRAATNALGQSERGTADHTLVRVTVLAPLLDELRDAMHQALTAGPLRRRIFELPFSRDVDLSLVENVQKLLDTLITCAQSGGVLLVTPEHRLSLLLKYYELSIAVDAAGAVVAHGNHVGDESGRNEDEDAESEEEDESDGRPTGVPAARRATRRQEAMRRAVQLLEKVIKFPAIDLLDEADEILRHKYQLVYATGAVEELDKGPERWLVTMGLLRVLQESQEVHKFFNDHDTAVWFVKSDEPHRFHNLRFLAASEDWSRDLKRDFAELLVDEFLSTNFLPFELQILASLKEDELKHFKAFVLNPRADLEKDKKRSVPEFRKLPDSAQDFGVALRCMLTYGVLFHCLEQTWQRNFGIDTRAAAALGQSTRCASAGKQLAKPFAAAHTPRERSEFSHVDVAICFTCVSLYWGGLADAQLRAAFEKLLNEGRNAAAQRYDRWTKLSRPTMERAGDYCSLDSWKKVDLSDEAQFEKLKIHFSHNFETVNYFLERCVFPVETRQHSHSISANPWNLAEGAGQTRGFSGTKDNKYVLPSPIEQQDLKELEHTDGKMMAVMTCNDRYYSAPCKLRDWREYLTAALRTGRAGRVDGGNFWRTSTEAEATVYSALIDAGGCMAGATNRQVAKFVLTNFNADQRFEGVNYHDAQLGGWTIMSRRNQVCELTRTSPIAPANCFTLYDEARTRGTDWKLSADARALVTLSEGMVKDKLMQAIGRMRGIEQRQTVSFFGSQEITRSIREKLLAGDERVERRALRAKDRRNKLRRNSKSETDSDSPESSSSDSEASEERRARDAKPLTSANVLYWVILNTVQAIEASLPLLAQQGAVYCSVQGNPLLAPQPKTNDLRSSFGAALKERKMAEVAKEGLERMMKDARTRCGGDPAAFDQLEPYKGYRDKIIHKVEEFGGRRKVFRNTLDEELERELQEEEEEELQRELPAPCEAAQEDVWDYSKVFDQQHCEHLLNTEKMFVPFGDLLRETHTFGGSEADRRVVAEVWERANQNEDDDPNGGPRLFVTRNYKTTVVEDEQGPLHKDDYMRPRLHFLLFFHAQNIAVLVSELEAENLLKLFYERDVQIRGLREPDLLRIPPESANLVFSFLRGEEQSASRPHHAVSFLNYSFLTEPRTDGGGIDAPLAVHSDPGVTLDNLSPRLLAKLQIANGDSMFPGETVREEVAAALRLTTDDDEQAQKLGKTFARKMIQLRGRSTELDHSDLERMLLRARG